MSELQLHRELPVAVWRDNPAFAHLLGISPLLAISDSSIKAVALGIALLIVCVSSAMTLSLLSSQIQSRYKFLWYGVILASYTSLVVLVLQLFFFPLARELGIYTYLIACNFALLLKMDGYVGHKELGFVATDSLKLGLSLLLALVLFSVLREIFLTGSLFQGWQLLIPGESLPIEANLDSRSSLFRFMALQPAAFILLGLLLAVLRKFGKLNNSPLLHREQNQAKRARVTGRLKKSA
ncbi:MAG: hypothetical protein MI746_08730 [Pseudomonadales bacterium]|nr:hypothetical protein [Pseudomonadales bacterium]